MSDLKKIRGLLNKAKASKSSIPSKKPNMTPRETLVYNLTIQLGNKLKSLKMTIKDVIREVDEDDSSDYDVLKCYELNKRIKILTRLNDKDKK